MKLTLKKKLTFAVLLLTFIFGSIATVGVFIYSKNLIFSLQKESLRRFSIENSNVAKQLFDDILSIADSISRHDEIKGYLQAENQILQREDILEHLKVYKINKNFDVIYLMDKNGLAIVSTDESFINQNYSFRDYFKASLEGRRSIDFYLGITSKKLGYYFSSPVFDEAGVVLGTVVIKIKPEIIETITGILSYDKDSHIMILDRYGVILYADKEERLYKSIGELSDDDKRNIGVDRKYEDLKIDSIQYNEVKKYLNTMGQVEVISIYDEFDGEEEVLSINRIGDWPFFIVIEEKTDKYLNLANKIALTFSLMAFVTALLAVFIMFLFINNFIKPINKLKNLAEEISRGNLSVRANIKTGDEIEDLAKSFNIMAAQTEKNIKNIEKEVSKRTKKLEELNAYMIGRELKMIELKNQLKNKNKI